MRALVFEDVSTIRLAEVADPAPVEATDAVVRVELTAICGSDMHVYHGRERGLDAGTGKPDAAFMQDKGIEIPEEFPLDHLGRLTCATCHNPHAEGELRGDFVGMMVCAQCHKKF